MVEKWEKDEINGEKKLRKMVVWRRPPVWEGGYFPRGELVPLWFLGRAPTSPGTELCASHYILCTMHYVLCIQHYALCTLHYAISALYYALCTMHYICMYYVLCTMDYATYPDKPRPRTHFPTMQRTDMKCYTIFHQTIVMLHKYIVQVLGQGWRRSLLIFYASMFVFFSILALTIVFLYLFLYHMCLPGALYRVVQGLEPGRVLYLYLYLYFTSYWYDAQHCDYRESCRFPSLGRGFVFVFVSKFVFVFHTYFTLRCVYRESCRFSSPGRGCPLLSCRLTLQHRLHHIFHSVLVVKIILMRATYPLMVAANIFAFLK